MPAARRSRFRGVRSINADGFAVAWFSAMRR